MRIFPPLLALVLLCCGCGPETPPVDPLKTVTVTLPNGKKILAEVKAQPAELHRGMMFRDSLPEGRGMLFIHGKPDRYTYWTFQCRIPLDIIWMDASRRIVEMSENTPPCQTAASECPHYGGREISLYVLELGAGEAARNGLRLGQTLSF